MKILFPLALLGLSACVETTSVAAPASEPAARAETGVTGYSVHRSGGVTTIVGSLH